jgi:hypothetical protein
MRGKNARVINLCINKAENAAKMTVCQPIARRNLNGIKTGGINGERWRLHAVIAWNELLIFPLCRISSRFTKTPVFPFPNMVN